MATTHKNKYLGSKIITQVTKRPGDSQFCSGLMSIKEDFLAWAILFCMMVDKLDFGRTHG
jgi:hypothetical protein